MSCRLPGKRRKTKDTTQANVPGRWRLVKSGKEVGRMGIMSIEWSNYSLTNHVSTQLIHAKDEIIVVIHG